MLHGLPLGRTTSIAIDAIEICDKSFVSPLMESRPTCVTCALYFLCCQVCSGRLQWPIDAGQWRRHICGLHNHPHIGAHVADPASSPHALQRRGSHTACMASIAWTVGTCCLLCPIVMKHLPLNKKCEFESRLVHLQKLNSLFTLEKCTCFHQYTLGWNYFKG